MKPTWTSGRPPLASASTRRSDDSLSMVSGFSHRAYLPCSRQASTCSSWTNPGEAMTTASTSGSAMRSRGSPTLRTPSKAAARSAARAVSGSDTATRRGPGDPVHHPLGVVGAHHADADHADAKVLLRHLLLLACFPVHGGALRRAQQRSLAGLVVGVLGVGGLRAVELGDRADRHVPPGVAVGRVDRGVGLDVDDDGATVGGSRLGLLDRLLELRRGECTSMTWAPRLRAFAARSTGSRVALEPAGLLVAEPVVSCRTAATRGTPRASRWSGSRGSARGRRSP